jgi:endonuclease/exonuclease/phosphatase family metal-dependent hydrolase
MAIRPLSAAPSRTAGPTTTLPTPAATKTPVDSGDFSASPVRVVTYNTGVADSMKAPQAEFTSLPMFQRVINGRPDAPIIGVQETGPDLAAKLQALSKNGNFTVLWERTGANQGNFVLVPKRYQVVSAQNHYYGGRLSQLWDDIKGLFHHQSPNWGQTLEHRGYQQLQLRDTVTGKTFTMMNSHISFWDPMRQRQGAQLAEAVRAAEANGPVVMTGDFNTATEDTNRSHNPQVSEFWNKFAPAKLTDMGPKGDAGISDWHGLGTDIDHVLANGFTSVSSHMYSGTEVSLPGRPTAKDLSDHYAEEDVINFS